MILTPSDIGTTISTVEDNLTKHFKTATSWGAVLLIDEADVFMERRTTADLERNGLVAGKLMPCRWPRLKQQSADNLQASSVRLRITMASSS